MSLGKSMAAGDSLGDNVVVRPNQPDTDGKLVDVTDYVNAALSKLGEAIECFNSTSASELLAEVGKIRESNNDPSEVEQFLNGLLSFGPDQRLPFWTNFRPAARFSKRARLASLRRTLDATTPPPNESDKETSNALDPLDRLRRRRRAFVSLLRTLASPPETDATTGVPAIVSLEKKAKRTVSNMNDLESRRPTDLETPDYDVILRYQDAGYEIRQYKPYAVCSVPMNKPRPDDSARTDAKLGEPKMEGASSFGALAGYLFGKNQAETAMKMTTPVLTNGQGDSKEMSFVLPSTFWTDGGLSLAPKPLEGSKVQLRQKNTENRAVVMFGGYASKQEVEKKKSQLINAIAKDKDWEITDSNSITLAQYNDPFTPPWKRLNEVSVTVRQRQ